MSRHFYDSFLEGSIELLVAAIRKLQIFKSVCIKVKLETLFEPRAKYKHLGAMSLAQTPKVVSRYETREMRAERETAQTPIFLI